MLYSLTQMLDLEQQLSLPPTLGLLPPPSELQDCVRGWVIPVDQIEEEEEVEVEEVVVVVLGEQAAVVGLLAPAVVSVGQKAGGSCTSQNERSSSIHRESWM